MNNENSIVNILFDPAGGSCGVRTKEGKTGEAFGELPVPTRRGYRFDGWYLGDRPVGADSLLDAEEDVLLTARYSREAKDSRVSMLKKEKCVAVILLAAVVLLVGALLAANYFASFFPLIDTYTLDGEEYRDKYYIRKNGDVYALYDGDGNLMQRNELEVNVYIAARSGNQYQIDPDTGDYTSFAIVDTEGTEQLGVNSRVLIFPQIKQACVYSVDVTNQYGNYQFTRESGSVRIKGFEDSAFSYDQKQYAYLCNSAGFPYTSAKLDPAKSPKTADGKIDYAAYGLDAPQATFTVTSLKWHSDGNGNIIAETDADGKYIPDVSYTVKVGSATLAANGYYVQLEGRDTVYVVDNTMESTILQPVEALVTPQVTAAVAMASHTMAVNFRFAKLAEWMGEGSLTDNGKVAERILELPTEGVINNDNIISAFSYRELDYRINTMYSTKPYVSEMPLMTGYNINDLNVSDVLGSLYSMQFIRCCKIGVSDDVLKEYHLDKDVFIMTYWMKTGRYTSDGKDVFIQNQLIIGQNKNENGNYYVASPIFNMVVEADPYYFAYLEWDSIDWYEKKIYSNNLAQVKELHFTFGDRAYDFTMDNTLSYAYYRTTDLSGEQVLSVADSEMGTLYKKGAQYYYKEKNGTEHPIVAVIDFEKTKVVTYTEAMRNPDLTDILYLDDHAESGSTPDYRIYYRYEKGLEAAISEDSVNMRISCAQYQGGTESPTLLDYVVHMTYVSDTGTVRHEDVPAITNFRLLYRNDLLAASLEGDVDEAEFKEKTGKSTADYLKENREKYDASITYRIEDMAKIGNNTVRLDEDGKKIPNYPENNEEYVRIRFYQYTDWKMLVTVEKMEKTAGGEWKAPEEVAGKFYMLASQLEKIETDIVKLLNEEVVDPASIR